MVYEVLKIGPAFLETIRVDIGNIIGNDIKVRLLYVHAGAGSPQSPNHKCLLEFS
jgi:hypothetical protein